MSNPVARVVSGSPGTCCSCANQVDPCNCSDTTCGLACRSKGGTATLCGYDEFGTPSVPPKKYRQISVSTAGAELSVCTTIHTPCKDSTCDSAYSDSYTKTFFDSVAVLTGALASLGPDGMGNIQYLVSCSGQVTFTGPPPSGPFPIDCTIHDQDGHVYHDGNTITLSETIAPDHILNLVSTFGGGVVSPTKCMTVTEDAVTVTADTWNFVGLYAVSPGCTLGPCGCSLSQTDLGDRQSSSTGSKCLTPGGPTFAIPGTDPETVYGAGVTATVPDGTHKTINPVGCLGPANLVFYSGGPIDETLTIEDTDDDAETRALVGIDWTGGACDAKTAFRTARGAGEFSFGFRKAQVQASVGFGHPLTPGHTYEVTIGFYRRVEGSFGPYTFFGTFVVTFTADFTVHVTDWIDIPNEEGWETKATSCTVKDVTPP